MAPKEKRVGNLMLHTIRKGSIFNQNFYFFLSLSKRKPNIFDNMVAILEKHASNLEKQVAERTRLLTEEKKKTDALLYSMLPR